jgi:CRP-like cAMP-binding protein
MEHPCQSGLRNALLRSIPEAEFAILEQHLQPIELNWRTIFDGRAEGSIFIEDGLATMALTDAEGRGLALAIIGSEGMIGSASALGLGDAPFQYRIHMAGHGFHIAGEVLVALQENLPKTRLTLLSYNQTLLVQFAETARVNKAELVETRLARWLLLCCDRLQTDELWITHDGLADCLGIRRAGVTDALHIIEGKGAIRSLRGRIIIRNRELLLMIARDFHGLSTREYNRDLLPVRSANRSPEQTA